MISLFFVGIVEMIIVTLWTKAVTESKILASGVITMINIFIWYYVLETIVGDINNWRLIFVYALGCSIGVVLTIVLFPDKTKRKARKTAKTEALNRQLAVQKE